MSRVGPAWMLGTLALASAIAACGDGVPPGLRADGGMPLDLGEPPDMQRDDAGVGDLGVPSDGGMTYCGRVGAVHDLAHFALPKTRFADVVAGTNTIDALFVASREEGDVVVRQAFATIDGALSGAEHVISEPGFGTIYAPRAASSPFAGLASYDSFATGTTRTTTIRSMAVDGSALGDERIVSDREFPSLRSQVAALSGGGFALAWTEAELQIFEDGTPVYVDTHLRYIHVDEAGVVDESATVIPTDAPIRGFTLARGGDDSALVYVLDRSATSGRAQSVYVRPINADGTVATASIELAGDHTIIDEISAIRVTGNTVVAWTEVTASLRSDIHVQRVTDEGTLAVERVVTRGTEQGGSPALSLFGAFHLGLVYVGGPSGQHTLRFLELEIDELPKEAAVTIADTDMNGPATIGIGISEDRTTLGVAWTQTGASGNDAHFALVGCSVAGEPTDGGWCEPDGGM